MNKDLFKRRDFSEQKLALLASMLEKEGVPQAPRLERIPRNGELPLSSAEMRLWLFDQLEPASSAYNIPVQHEFKGHFDLVAFERSLSEIVRRHEPLRTSYLRVDGRPVQKINPPELFRIPVVDLQGLPKAAREQEVARLLSIDAQQPFDLGSAPKMRARLLKSAPDEHILLLNFHHIAFDWWSFGVFEEELAALYNSFLRGEEASPLPELPIQYVDFAAWQRQRLQGEILQQDLEYWQKKLSGTLPVLELPTDHPRPAIQTYNGSFLCSTLSGKLTEALKILSQREGITLFTTLLAAFKVLLHRYTGQDDILVGAPIAGRNSAEVEGLIGFFVNTLVMRTDLSGNPTFRQLLRRVQETTMGAFAHQDLPFEKLVEVLNPERDPSRSPMFQVMLSMLNTPVRSLNLSGLQDRRILPSNGASKFDLTLFAMEDSGQLSFICEYNTDLFHADAIERMIGHLEVLLEGIVGDPDQRLSELPLLTPEERHQLLIEWNDLQVSYPEGISLHGLFEAQVERTPDAIAVKFEGSQLSYRELNQRANQLACYLRKQGVRAEIVVAMCMERSLEMIVGILGVLKAGGAYLPLDLSYPPERLAFMINDAKPPVILTQEKLKETLPEHGAQIVCLDCDQQIIGQENAENLSAGAGPDSLAYVIYTSGSTGKPKGCMVTHHNVIRLFQATWDWYRFDEHDVWTMFHSYAFDFSVWEIWGALFYGGRVVIVPYLISRSPEEFYQLLHDEHVTVLNQTPSAFRQLIQAEENVGVHGLALRYVIFGGEALETQSLKPWYERHGDRKPLLVNMYGITETTVHVTYRPLSLSDTAGGSVIGRRIPDLQLYILDRHRQLVPVGVPGEMYVGGAGVARGYLSRPELTSERFVPDPFSSRSDMRLYKTGDLARFLPDGDVEYLGRIDHQVKIRGFRIELGEIESVLSSHPAVAQCVVVAREDSHGDKILAAYLEPRPGRPAPQVSDLRQHLANDLPAYMVPSAFVVLDQLPLTPNGKIDRNALPAPSFDHVGAAHESLAPRTETEQALATIWSEVLKVGGIGVHDNFFDLGGHSLLVIRAVSRIRDVFEVELLPSSFFAHPTVAGLAKVLAEDKGEGGAMSRIERRNQDGPCALSYAQERLWFLDQLAPDSPVYNIVDVVAFEGSYNAEAMQRAANELVRRHEPLRTAFSNREGQPVQIVVPTVDVAFPEVDLRQLPEKEREETWIRLAQEEGQKPFNLAQPPLLRGTLVQLSEQKQLLLLTVHHIIADEWSMEVLQRELHQLYRAFCQGEPSPLAELPIRYIDFVHWQRGYLQGEVLQKQVGFWKEALAGAPTILELPTDKPRPAVQSFRGAVEAFELPRELLERLKLLSRQQDATLFMTLSAAFMTLLHRYTGQDDILVGTPISGRTRSETEDLIGLFLNLVILRAQFSGEGTFQSLLQQVRQRALGAYGHQDLPFEQLVAELAPERDLSRTPLFQVMFVLFSTEAASQASDAAGLAQLATGTSKFDLTLAVSETEAGLRGVIEYRTDLFEAETIRRLGGHYGTLLDAISRDPDQIVSALPILADGERQQLLEEWNNTAVAQPESDLCLPQMIAEQARKNPDQVALIFQEQELSYGELNQRANQLAHYLRTLGVGPDVLVGLCVERSLEMVVGLLGILKAGGAYVPLDPSFPEARLAYMIADSGMRVLVTHRQLDQSLPVRPASIVYLDADWEAIARQDTTDAGLRPARPENLAYVLYTSGSTGKPKGVAIPHAAVVNFLRSMQREPGFGAKDRLLAVTTLSFDIAGLELYLPLVTGGTTVIASREDNYDPARLIGRIRESQCTVMQATPATWRALLEAGWEGSRNLKLLCGGEALPADLAQALLPRCAQLWNMYGPTETTIWSTVHQVTSVDGPVPIGRPIANTQVFILDGHRQLVPPGIVGELYIGGSGLARGYLARPELTAERFVESPFEPSARLYRTGDRARWRADGTLECLGRVDNQVKIRGFRIEPGEVESALARHPAVAQCVVVAREDSHGDKILAAYLEPRPGRPAPQVSDLRQHLANDLPAYMVPSAFVVLDQLPLTPNGKIDRNALPAPSFDHVGAAHESLAPRTETEQALATIWSEVLKVGGIGVHDNFFDLGGHSLLVIRAVSRIRDVFEVELLPSSFFAHPTVAGLAKVLAEDKGEGGAMSRIERRNQDGPCALSYAQERLWFLDQLAPDSPVYNIVDVVAFEGSYNAEAMQRAANELVRRHEPLRTAFSNREGQPVQIVVPTVDVAFPEVDLRQLPEKEREETWIRLAQEEGQKPFNLAQPPLLRGTLVQLSEQKQLLLLTVHHIIADEWSMEVLQRELHQLYRAFCQGEPSPLAELPIRYIDFVHWQRGYLQGEVLQKQVGFWKEALAGAPTILELPTDKPRPAVQSFRGAVEAFELPRELLERLKLLSRQQDATLFMTLSAAFMTLLHRYTGQDDILVGTPISGRTRSETEDLIGLFLNLVILRAQFSGEGTFQSLLQQVRQRALGAYGHQDLPFEQLVAELAPERDLSRTPLFQVMFVLFSTEAASQASDAAGLAQLATGTSKFDLTLAVSETEAGLRGVIEYRTDLFEAETIRRLGGHYGTLLDAISRDPDQIVSALPILADGERQQLLEEWNNTAVAQPESDLCLPQMIAEQARKNPDQVALIFQEQELSYGELNQRANQLAHYLRTLGVGPDVLVGLCVERSLEMVVGLLGILKAGGAYVPLDPSFPEARLAYMIADSGMRVLVTHRQLDQSLPVRPASIVYLDADWEAIARQDTTDAGLRPARPENLAYVLYTSGSTGKPKGVAIPHAAVVNFLRSMQREPGFGAKDRLLAVTTLSFDIAGLELYLPLVTGGTTVIASREDNYDPARLIGRIRESQCTVMQATPATWRALLEAGWEGSRNLKLLCGGEALPADLAQALLPRCAQLWNMYGPTETTIWSTVHQVTSVDGPVPIGRPIANTQVFILDGHRQLVPPGIVGELYIGGSGLARGYLARPELTAERFVESPFEPSARLYRTGDRARWRADGTLECLGRVDNQVKIRGFRIEPGEVESALARHPAVAQCVVVAREDSHGDKILAAYLEPRPGRPAPQVSDLRQHLANDLPAYMVPSAFVVLDQLPLTPNGKIDRNALPAPNQERIEVSGKVAAPRDAIEQMLVQIWSRVLHVRSIGIHDNFFDLGGHSLLAVRIVAEIEGLVKKRLPLATFLQAPTIADLADVLRSEDWKPSWSSLTPIRAGGSRPPLFLMHSHGGNVLEYYPLAKYLEADQPVYALQARGLDGNIIKDQSFEAMAAAHLAELRSLQPQGPYFLGGYCLGGLLALEAAQQLSAAGEEVASVILIQSTNPAYARFRPDLTLFQRGWYRTTKRVGLELEYLRNRGANYFLDRCRRTWDIARARIAIAFDNSTGNGHEQQKRRSLAYTLEMLAIEHEKARIRYTPRSYNGPVILFRASKQLSGLMTDYTLGWKDLLTGSLEICEVPGRQETMLSDPNVSHLAEKLTAQLHAAQDSCLTAQLAVDSKDSVR